MLPLGLRDEPESVRQEELRLSTLQTSGSWTSWSLYAGMMKLQLLFHDELEFAGQEELQRLYWDELGLAVHEEELRLSKLRLGLRDELEFVGQEELRWSKLQTSGSMTSWSLSGKRWSRLQKLFRDKLGIAGMMKLQLRFHDELELAGHEVLQLFSQDELVLVEHEGERRLSKLLLVLQDELEFVGHEVLRSSKLQTSCSMTSWSLWGTRNCDRRGCSHCSLKSWVCRLVARQSLKILNGECRENITSLAGILEGRRGGQVGKATRRKLGFRMFRPASGSGFGPPW